MKTSIDLINNAQDIILSLFANCKGKLEFPDLTTEEVAKLTEKAVRDAEQEVNTSK